MKDFYFFLAYDPENAYICSIIKNVKLKRRLTMEQYLDYEIMSLDMKTLKTEVKKCLIEGNEDYLNELFIYGCWANKSELVNSDGDVISKAISLLHRKGFSILSAIEKNYSVKVIKTFLDGGADPNLQNGWGDTALMIAIEKAGSMGFKVDNDDLYIIKQLAMRHPDIEFRVRI